MTERAHHMLRAALRICLAVCLGVLPFELRYGLSLGPLTLTNVELLLLGALALWAATLWAERRRPSAPAWLAIGLAALFVTLLLSSLRAGGEAAGALKFTMRQAQGALLALCVADTLRTSGGARLFAGALVAGAGVSATLGLLEMTELPAAMAALAPFKTESTYMGGLLRLSGTLGYANTAAQYYEAVLPLAVLVAAAPSPPVPRARRAAAWLAPPVLLLATLLTFSRAAIAVTLLLLALTPLVAWRAFDLGAARRAALVCAGLLALGLGLAAASPTFRLRVAEPEVARWYGARYAPAPVGPMAPNELRALELTVENSGRIAWEPAGLRPVRLAYHWLDATTGAVVRYEGRRTLLPRVVAPGETVTVTATVQAPSRPGRYVLAWDMLREYIGRGWFSQMGIAPARVVVEVVGAPAPAPPPAADPPTAPRTIATVPGPPGRRALWGVALAMWRERPIVGIGPDVFRHTYGPRLGMELWDERVHTNSLYLELLTGAGVLGLGAFLAVAAATLWTGWRALGAGLRPGADGALLAGALLGTVAFLAHGLLDVFLAFTPTYALLWAMVGAIGGLADSRETKRARATNRLVGALKTHPES